MWLVQSYRIVLYTVFGPVITDGVLHTDSFSHVGWCPTVFNSVMCGFCKISQIFAMQDVFFAGVAAYDRISMVDEIIVSLCQYLINCHRCDVEV